MKWLLSALFVASVSGSAVIAPDNGADAAEVMEERLEKLGPVLDRLKKLDPKTFGKLNSLIAKSANQSQNQRSFLQSESTPEQDMKSEAAMEKLGPIMDRLKGLDPAMAGALSKVISSAEHITPKEKTALIQAITVAH